MTYFTACCLIAYANVRATYLVRDHYAWLRDGVRGRAGERPGDRRVIRIMWCLAVLNTWLAAWEAWRTI